MCHVPCAMFFKNNLYGLKYSLILPFTWNSNLIFIESSSQKLDSDFSFSEDDKPYTLGFTGFTVTLLVAPIIL